MYRILCGGAVLYDPRGANASDRLIVRDPSVDLAVNSAGSMALTIDATHPLAGTINHMSSEITVEEDGTPFFRGRVSSISSGFRNEKKMLVEGMLAAMNDTIIPPYLFPEDFANDPEYQSAAEAGNVVEFFLKWAVGLHNQTAPSSRQVTVRNVTVLDPNNYISRSSEAPSSAWECISDKLLGSSLGGHLVVTYTASAIIIDYLADYEYDTAQEIRFASNLLDVTQDTNAEDIFTAVYPVGADGLDIQSITDGEQESGMIKEGRIVYDPARVATYGRITKVLDLDDVTLPEHLLTKSETVLVSAAAEIQKTIEVQACDLHALDESMIPFRPGKLVHLISEPHGLDMMLPIIKVSINLVDPTKTPLTLSGGDVEYTTAAQKKNAFVDKSIDALKQKATGFPNLAREISSDLTKAILGANGGTVRFLDEDGDGEPDTIYIADSPDPSVAQYVWRWNYLGWAASANGYTGPFTMGATMENGILADFVTAAHLTAGTIQSQDGQSFYLNLDTGEFRAGATAISVNGQPLGETIQSLETNTSDALDKLRALSGYITYEGGVLTLGDINSNVKLTLENDGLKFVNAQTGDVIAYFTNDKLHTYDGIDVGNDWEVTTDNGFSIRWKGDD